MIRDFQTDSRRTLAFMTGAAFLALALSGCATTGHAPAVTDGGPDQSDVVHPTVDGAALDALAALRADRHPATRGRFRVGRILAVPGGFVWEAPVAAKAGPRPVVRLESGPDHVATYLSRDAQVSGSRAALERRHARTERSLVTRQDALHRPLFVLTGSGRVIAYRGDATPEPLPTIAAAD